MTRLFEISCCKRNDCPSLVYTELVMLTKSHIRRCPASYSAAIVMESPKERATRYMETTIEIIIHELCTIRVYVS